MTFDAVVFDMDGTLLDTERVALQAFKNAATQLGGHISEELFIQAIGRGEEDARRIFLGELGQNFDYDQMIEMVTVEIHRECEQGVPPKPGAKEIFDFLQQRKVPFAIATSTNLASAKIRLDVVGLLAPVQAIVGGDEIEKGKPAPDIYLRAAERLGVEPQRCVAIEDSAPGITAARAAGMKAILVPDVAPATDEMRETAHHVFESLLEVKDWLLGNG